jgi:hypothetical protein
MHVRAIKMETWMPGTTKARPNKKTNKHVRNSQNLNGIFKSKISTPDTLKIPIESLSLKFSEINF